MSQHLKKKTLEECQVHKEYSIKSPVDKDTVLSYKGVDYVQDN